MKLHAYTVVVILISLMTGLLFLAASTVGSIIWETWDNPIVRDFAYLGLGLGGLLGVVGCLVIHLQEGRKGNG